ncbi:hypothetical protein Tco_0678848 [Tanacetum coccineum]|uniref:Uncharacterized protein n=1 Tax=Tanacetum coccineum TaxID=301880 RepID=A0ABQ4XG71_9ASTR
MSKAFDDIQERELHQLQLMKENAKESCKTSFRLLHSFLQHFLDYDSEMTKKLFAEYTRIQVKQFRETLLLHMANVKKSVAERTHHKRQYDRRIKERQMQSRESKVVSSKALDASLVVTECSGTKSDEHITSSSSGNYITHVVDANIVPSKFNQCHLRGILTTQHNVLANVQQHTNQSEPSYDTYLLEKDSQEEPYGSSVMAHNHYLEEARKKTQERNRNSRPSVMHTTSLQNTTNGSKPNPRSNNQISRSLPVSKSSYGMSNGVSLAKVDSRAKVQSPKTRNKNKPVEPKSHTQKPGRQIAIGQRFSPKKSSAVHEKPNTPRSCLRWKPTGRIFKIVGLRWIPTGKMFTDNTTKVDSEPPNGLNGDITNPYE